MLQGGEVVLTPPIVGERGSAMTNVVIVSAARTAVGSFNGSFANTPAHDLGAAVIEAVVARAGIDKAEVEETILGQVLTAGQGQNPARQAHIKAGLACAPSRWVPSMSNSAMPRSSSRAVRKACPSRPMSPTCGPAPRWAT